jgi:hypothetical protein
MIISNVEEHFALAIAPKLQKGRMGGDQPNAVGRHRQHTDFLEHWHLTAGGRRCNINSGNSGQCSELDWNYFVWIIFIVLI